MASLQQLALPRPDATPADCRHSREPFDQGFHVVSRRPDLSSDAKVVHAFLVSLYRAGYDLTQREIAAEIGLTRHRVWSAIRELAAAELVRPIRYGLGRPNGYALLGIDQANLDGRKQSSGQSGQRPPASPDSPRARVPSFPKERRDGRTGGYTQANVDPAAFTGGRYGWAVKT